jgi:hypothetical protein
MAERLNYERKLAIESCHGLWSRMFEIDTTPSDWHLIVRAIGEINDF